MVSKSNHCIGARAEIIALAALKHGETLGRQAARCGTNVDNSTKN